jgi:hypothetical protein
MPHRIPRGEAEDTICRTAGCSKRSSSAAAGETKPEAYPLGYVEDFVEPRTKLAAFFSSLLEDFSILP